MDSITFNIDFKTKFLQIGLDSENNFDLTVHIITSLHHVVNSLGRFLKTDIFLSEGISSYSRTSCDLWKNSVFGNRLNSILLNMVYQREKVLIIQSKNKN